MDPLTGRPTYKTVTFRGGKREAEAELARFVTQVSGGGHGAGDTTLADLIEWWLDLAREDLLPRPFVATSASSGAIPPHHRQGPAEQARDASAGQVLCAASGERGRAGRCARAGDGSPDACDHPSSAQSSPSVGMDRDQPGGTGISTERAVRPVNPPEPQGVLELVAAAEASDPDLGCFLLLAATTGARRGELSALRWSDVDFGERTVLIARSLVERPGIGTRREGHQDARLSSDRP